MKKQKSYITIISVIVVGLIGTAATLALTTISIDSIKSASEYESGKQAEYYARSCGEKALANLRLNLNYAGNESVSFDKGTCQILAIENSGTQTPIVKVSGQNGNAIKRYIIQVSQVNPQVTISSYTLTDQF